MTLTAIPRDPLLDLDPWVGQRQCTYRFNLTDGVTGANLGEITPLRGQGRSGSSGQFGGGSAAGLTHDTSRTVKRQLTMSLGAADTAAINPVRERVSVTMVFPAGQEFPLGRYMFSDSSRAVFTSGKLGNVVLNDEMFLVDQQISQGINGVGRGVTQLVADIMEPLPVTLQMEASTFSSAESWGIGFSRGQILESLAVAGDYFSPWFDNDGIMRFIRSFDPFKRVPDFDFDDGFKVMRTGIRETDNILTAPNRFVVISNAADDATVPVVGTANVPATAPHSEANRGFVIPDTQDLQLLDQAQAQAVAQNMANRQTVFETVSLNTAPDPRHDSYNVVHWQGELWLELAWSMALAEGGEMGHLLRKAYKP